ncbi:MAG TPA: dihydropyrimidinase [Anaerolineae bacterium]|nr:dihydropyrimidinase [Anaerolineae bacterium]
MDSVVTNGQVVTASGLERLDVGIHGGRIAELRVGLEGPNKIDAQGCYVFPGFVDPHVHLEMNVGGNLTSDDLASGTVAAACGGTTTIIDFTENRRGDDLESWVTRRRAQADGRVAVDYALHLQLADSSPSTLAALRRLSEQGYRSAKLYTTYDGVRLSDRDFLELLTAVRDAQVLPMVHTENDHAIAFLTRRLLAQGLVAPRYHADSRPPLVEAEAANRVAILAGLVNAPLYIAHLTCAETLERVQSARQRGQRVFAETCPQYLLLSTDEYDRPGFEGAKYVLSPPLRDQANWPLLWEALAEDALQVVSTDHCPWNYATQKALGRHAFNAIPNGAPGIETRIPLLFSEGVGKGRLSLQRFVEVCATSPARIFGLYPRKGVIAVGADADLVIYDPQRRVTLSQANLHQRVDYCPYEGREVVGYPSVVLLRGEVIVENGQFVGRRGQGQFVRREVSCAY